MKLLALIGAGVLATTTMAPVPADAQYRHGYHGYRHGGGYYGHRFRGGYRGYGYRYRYRHRGYRHRDYRGYRRGYRY